MGLDPEIFKQLIETFKTELEEQLQVITNGILSLEKNDLDDSKRVKTIASIFRAAHSIKGAARSLGITDPGEIAHQVESLFSAIQRNEIILSSDIIDLCLEAVDKMRMAMQSYLDKKPLSFDLPDILQRLGQVDKSKPLSTVPLPDQKKEKKTPDATQPLSTELTGHETIRVSLAHIDRVSALMEEMQVNKIAIDDHYTELSKLTAKINHFSHVFKQLLFSVRNNQVKEENENIKQLYYSGSDSFSEIYQFANQLHKNMRNRINELTTLSNSLQEEVRLLRLVPIENLLITFPRYLRDISHELNKEIELNITGGEVKIDKMVLEGLKDPLIHLLRNAVDHGIENGAERLASGKSESGHISIDIREEGNQILISVTDDGAGIDAKKIADTAIRKNIISSSELETMNENEILELIFRPGFSTREIITDVSGRGVGLDVVKTNLVPLKGQVGIKTDVGKGTTFYLRVPLTLTSERGLLLCSGGEVFVIPTHYVERVLAVNVNEIFEIEASQAVMLDGHPLLLRSLASVLDLDKKESFLQDQFPVVVIRKDWQVVAFLVDEIIGEREIVIKPLQEPLSNVPTIAGGTLSGSGHVIIVLNPLDLINQALHSGRMESISFSDEAPAAVMRPRILVVDDSITTRTLEKNILESKNYEVTVAVNGKEAWDLLQKQKFSLLITDVSMPIMDGFTLTDQIKKNEKMRGLPVIIVTSLGSDAEKKRGIEVGADAYIIKSEFESGALLEVVAQLV